MLDIKNIVKGFKKHDVVIGIIVGLLAIALFKFTTGWILLGVSAIILVIASSILTEKTGLKPDIMTMAGCYWVVLVLGIFTVQYPVTTVSIAATFLASLVLGSIYAFITFLLTAFLIFIVAVVLKVKKRR